MLPAVLMSILMNLCFLVCFYSRELRAPAALVAPVTTGATLPQGPPEPTQPPAMTSLPRSSFGVQSIRNLLPSARAPAISTFLDSEAGLPPATPAQEKAMYFIFFFLVLGFMGGHLIDLPCPWVVLVGVAMLTLVKVFIENKPGTDVLCHADGPLLILISALCIMIAGVQQTGVPGMLFEFLCGMAPQHSCAKLFTGKKELALLTLFLVILSNVISNVPVVLLVAPNLDEAGSPKNWLIVSWVTTVAGNLTLIGSLANVLVAEKAKERGVTITFWSHFKFASWSTVCTILVGCLLIRYVPC